MRFSTVLCAAALASTASLAHADPIVPEGTVAQVKDYEHVVLPDGRDGVAYTILTYAWARQDHGHLVLAQPRETLRIVQPVENHRVFFRGADVAINFLPNGEPRLRYVDIRTPSRRNNENSFGGALPSSFSSLPAESHINFNLGK